MSGTREGGLKTVAVIKETYGEDFFKRIGSKGGKWTGVKGFAAMTPEQRREAGRKGGTLSRRNRK